jgi:hypothetical protein
MSTQQVIQEMQELGSDVSTLLNYLALSEDHILDFEVIDKSSSRVLWKHLVYMDKQGRLVRILVYDDGRRQRTSPTKLREVLYDNNFEVYKRFDLSHGLVISFNLSGPRIYDISYETTLEPETGFTYVENCPLNKDEEGYYVPSDADGKSLREYGSRCGVFNLNDYLVKNYRLTTAHLVDLVIKEGELPRLAWVHQDNKIKSNSTNITSVSSKSSRNFAKYDFDLKGKKVAILGLPKSQVERFKSLVLTEKKAEELEVIASSSHNDTELVPDKLKDFDIVIVVKRFVGHGTIYHLKSLLDGSQAQLVNSSSHGLDGLERALYRGVKGYPSEEGATVVDYPLL